jgi:hypothetical protein
MVGRWLLFVSSYSPLFALIAIRLEPSTLQIALFVMAVGGAAGLFVVLAAASRIEPKPCEYSTAEDRGVDVAGYLATYLVPFLTVSRPTSRDVLAYACFLALVGIIYVRSTLVGVNPLMYLLRFRLFAVKDSKGHPHLLISRAAPPLKVFIPVRRVLGLDVHFEEPAI